MKIHIFLILTLFTSPFCFATEQIESAESVIVRSISTPLPIKEDAKKKFLWDTFANKPEEKKFSSHPTLGWKEDYQNFSNELVRKAKLLNLNSDSLNKILELILKSSNGELAYLPVGAYSTFYKNSPIWIIVVKWELSNVNSSMGHIRIYAYDANTLERVGFNTCM
jgi:hypothetical protein